MWSLLAALHPVEKDTQRVSKYKQYENDLNFDGINFPIKIKDIPKIEKMNNLSINVLSNEQKEIIPIYVSKQKHIPYEEIIDLFLIKNEDTEDSPEVVSNDSHYCWIKNINRLLGNELSNHTGNQHICRRCFVHFSVKHKYD